MVSPVNVVRKTRKVHFGSLHPQSAGLQAQQWLRHSPPSSYIEARREPVNHARFGFEPVVKRQSYIIIFRWRNFSYPRSHTETGIGGWWWPIPSSLTPWCPPSPPHQIHLPTVSGAGSLSPGKREGGGSGLFYPGGTKLWWKRHRNYFGWFVFGKLQKYNY